MARESNEQYKQTVYLKLRDIISESYWMVILRRRNAASVRVFAAEQVPTLDRRKAIQGSGGRTGHGQRASDVWSRRCKNACAIAEEDFIKNTLAR